MMRRYMISMPSPGVGCDVVYHSNPSTGDWPAKVTRVRNLPTEADPFGARADLVVFAGDGTVYLSGAPYGREPGQWSYPPPRPDHVTAVVDEDDEAPGPAASTPPAHEWYRKFLQGH